MMFTKPADIFMRRAILDDPPVEVSVLAISEFLTAKPMPYCLGSSGDRPCQKKVQSLSISNPLSASRVS